MYSTSKNWQLRFESGKRWKLSGRLNWPKKIWEARTELSRTKLHSNYGHQAGIWPQQPKSSYNRLFCPEWLKQLL